MTEAERRLCDDLQVRNEARAVVMARVDRVRSALSRKPVPQRALDDALGRARSGLDEAAAITRESRWIVAATLTAVAAWLLRRPLAKAFQQAKVHLAAREPASAWQRCKAWVAAWVVRKVRS